MCAPRARLLRNRTMDVATTVRLHTKCTLKIHVFYFILFRVQCALCAEQNNCPYARTRWRDTYNKNETNEICTIRKSNTWTSTEQNEYIKVSSSVACVLCWAVCAHTHTYTRICCVSVRYLLVHLLSAVAVNVVAGTVSHLHRRMRRRKIRTYRFITKCIDRIVVGRCSVWFWFYYSSQK